MHHPERHCTQQGPISGTCSLLLRPTIQAFSFFKIKGFLNSVSIQVHAWCILAAQEIFVKVSEDVWASLDGMTSESTEGPESMTGLLWGGLIITALAEGGSRGKMTGVFSSTVLSWS